MQQHQIRKGKRPQGQALTESVLTLPFFLFFVFAALQVSQAGMALLVTNYAASTIARTAANQESFSALPKSGHVNLSAFSQKALNLMVGGIQLDDVSGLEGCVSSADPRVPTGELAVAVRAKFLAWPFFAQMTHTALQGQYDATPLSCPDLENVSGFGPFNFSAQPPYYWYVTGVTKVRLNYIQ